MCDLATCASRRRRVEVPLEQRRAFLRGAAGLSLAAVLAEPRLAHAAGERLEKVSITTEGGEAAEARIGLPTATPAPAVLLIHEWWGLDDPIKAVAAELVERGFVALAVDLYRGRVATTREQASAYRKQMDPVWATEALVGWIDWLRRHPQSSGRVGTVGWCFGGGWSLNASIAAPVDATVIYYGNVAQPAEKLARLSGPVLGHFGTEDRHIDAEMVGGFERAMHAAGRDAFEIHWYTADHAFANPSGARYDADDAALAWARTLAFFHRHLDGA